MFTTSYPYLISSLIMLLAFTAGVILVPAQRLAMLISGLLSAPFAFSSVIFVPEYWQPKRIACFLTGPEDLIFSFAGGGLVWLTATCVLCPRLTVSLQAGRMARRYLFWSLFFFTLVLTFKYLFGLSTMTGTLISGALFYIVLLVIRRDLFIFSAVAGFGYCIIYTLFCISVFSLWPDFLNQWNWDNLTGLTVIGVPIEEPIWALIFASGWALGMGYIFEARLPEKRWRGLEKRKIKGHAS